MNSFKVNKNKVDAILQKRVCRGQVLLLDKEPYIVASFENENGEHLGYGLISLSTGNRWSKPVMIDIDSKVSISDLIDSDSVAKIELLDPGTEIVLTIGGF